MSELENLQTHMLPVVTPEPDDVIRIFRGTLTAQATIGSLPGEDVTAEAITEALDGEPIGPAENTLPVELQNYTINPTLLVTQTGSHAVGANGIGIEAYGTDTGVYGLYVVTAAGVDAQVAVEADTYALVSGTTSYGLSTAASIADGVATPSVYHVWASDVALGSGSSVTTQYGAWIGELASATNNYPFWSDTRGVWRMRSEDTFDSVRQSIAALYNPQFTKYTPGAADYERIALGQWNGNVAEIGTEKGGTGTLRPLRLICASLQVNSDIGLATFSGPVTNITVKNGIVTAAS